MEQPAATLRRRVRWAAPPEPARAKQHQHRVDSSMHHSQPSAERELEAASRKRPGTVHAAGAPWSIGLAPPPRWRVLVIRRVLSPDLFLCPSSSATLTAPYIWFFIVVDMQPVLRKGDKTGFLH